MDVRDWRRWGAPFVSYGKNAIVFYVGSELLASTLAAIAWGTGPDGEPFHLAARAHALLFASWLPPFAASLAFALATVLLWYVVARVMDRRGIYVEV